MAMARLGAEQEDGQDSPNDGLTWRQRGPAIVRRRRMEALSEPERFAVRLMRTALGDAAPDPAMPAVRLARPDDPLVTRDERGLLHAVAAAQRRDDAVMDNYLVRMAPGGAARARLADAVRALAGLLAASGRVVASPQIMCWSLPAAALTVARLHGHDTSMIPIAWPPR
ncbi:hypothetical protein [Rhizosaccharibacter radicis]|uniref:Uncharacterized protein n=1 Tax=Rhizosaccharibacter radicis TaxID=2782605 RepID=A0ABT1W1U8_9PROT|nr:hypothetical protein [Acetobacteraceae bacterium KSS12]